MLKVENLTIRFEDREAGQEVVKGISFFHKGRGNTWDCRRIWFRENNDSSDCDGIVKKTCISG